MSGIGGVAGRRPPDAEPSVVRTPTLGRRLRRGRIWVVLGIVLVVGGALLIAVRGIGGSASVPLGPDDASPAGSRAMVEVLRAQGVRVEAARTLDQALSAAGRDTTVFLYDSSGLLDGEALDRLRSGTDRLVVAAPDAAALDALAPGVRHAGAAVGALDRADCSIGAAARAGALSDGQRLLAIGPEAIDDGWTGCFPDEEFGFALAAGAPTDGDAEVVLVGSTAAFANESIDESGNAALALGLTGAEPRLVWYLPGPTDAAGEAPTLADLTPGWVSPVLLLGIVVTVVAGVAAGRRFGPLVVEDLPVQVKAGETAAGRARLYASASARTHAIDQLRIGSIRRLARLLRLPRSANVDEVVHAVAGAVRSDPVRLRAMLADEEPSDGRRLVELAAELDRLEDAVHAALRPGAAPTTPVPPAEPATTTDRPHPTGRRP